MAIRKLKFVQVRAEANNYKEMLIKAYSCEDFHVEFATSIIDKSRGDRVLKEDSFYRDSMNELRHLSGGAGCGITLLDKIEKFTDEDIKQFLAELSEQFKAVSEINEMTKLEDADEIALGKLVEVGLEKIHDCQYLKFGLGRLSNDAYNKLHMHDSDLFSVVELNSDSKTHWVCYITSKNYYKEVKKIFDSLFFEEIKIPPFDVNNVICHYNDKINKIYTYCNYRHELLRLYKYVAVIEDHYVVSGFIPIDIIDDFKKIFDGLDVEIDIQDVVERMKMNSTDEQVLAKLSEFGLDKVNNCQYLRFGFGRMAKENYEKLLTEDTSMFTINELDSNKSTIWICFITSNNYYREVRQLLKSLHFMEIKIPTIDINGIIKLYKDKLNEIYTYCNQSDDILKLAKYVVRNNDTYVISGYLDKASLEALQEIFPSPVEISVRKLDEEETFAASLDENSLFVQLKTDVNNYKEVLAKANDFKALHLVTAESLLNDNDDDRELSENNFYSSAMDQLVQLAEKADLKPEIIEKVNHYTDEEIKQFITEMSEKLDVADEKENDEIIPPTLLKNNWFVKPFEMFVNMYSIPAYRDFDPTTFVCITYCILFGIMFSDFGQGLILAVGGAILYKLKPKMALAGIVARIGLFSMVFGFLFGSVFGFENVFTPIQEFLFKTNGKLINVMDGNMTMTLLILSVAIGSFLIMTTMLINLYLKFKHKEWGEFIFSNNGIAGFLFYGYVIVAVVESFVFGNNIVTLPYLIPFVYLPILCFLLEKQMVLVFEGQRLRPKNGWGNYVLESFFEVFEVLLGFVTNSMSYLRVTGFVLSHAGMMMVVMTLGEMMANASWLVIILGNVFVMCLEGLIVGIQALRLEYYEMFSRYYSGGGRKFKAITTEI